MVTNFFQLGYKYFYKIVTVYRCTSLWRSFYGLVMVWTKLRFMLSINLYIIPLLTAGSSNPKSWSSSCRTRIFNLASNKNIPSGSVKVHAWRQSRVGIWGRGCLEILLSLLLFKLSPYNDDSWLFYSLSLTTWCLTFIYHLFFKSRVHVSPGFQCDWLLWWFSFCFANKGISRDEETLQPTIYLNK